MTFWLQRDWQLRTQDAIKEALIRTHEDLRGKNLGRGAWTAETLRSLVPVAQAACNNSRVVCGLKFAPDDTCTGEWLYDFCCWIERPEGGGFVGLPIVAESEWGKWNDIWDDFDKLVQARAGLRLLVFEFQDGNTPPEWHAELSRRARGFQPSSSDDAWLFACWRKAGFEFKSGLLE